MPTPGLSSRTSPTAMVVRASSDSSTASVWSGVAGAGRRAEGGVDETAPSNEKADDARRDGAQPPRSSERAPRGRTTPSPRPGAPHPRLKPEPE